MAADEPSDGRPWRSRNLVVLSAVSLFQDAASELLYPILPVFLTTTLGAPVAVVAVTEGLADGAAAVTKAATGRLADRFGRRRLVGAGYGLGAAGKLLVAAAVAWPLVLLARMLDRFGKGLRGAPRDAIIADSVDEADRGRAFGFHRAADTTGAVVGPLVGLALYELLDHRIRPLLVLAVVPAVVSVALVRFVRDPTARRPRRPAPVPTPGRGHPLPQAYWHVAVVLTAFSVVNFSDALLLLRARELGLDLTAVIAAYVLFNLVYAVLSYPAGRLSDRVPRSTVYAGGLVLFGVTYVGLGVATTTAAVWVLLPLYGAFAALTDGVSRAWIADLVAAPDRTRALGYQQGLAGGGAIVAGLWAGLLWGGDGTLPLVVSGLAALVLAVAAVTVDRRRPT